MGDSQKVNVVGNREDCCPENHRKGECQERESSWLVAPHEEERCQKADCHPGYPHQDRWRERRELGHEVSQPILYVSAGESGPLFEAVKQHFQSLLPHTEVVVVPGVNHLMQMSDSKIVAAPIADFLSCHPF